jgi:hydrogenase maturation protein HypF
VRGPGGDERAIEIRVTGTVQGVGFRPTVWRLACEEGLVGEVLNDGAGVIIRTNGDADRIASFVARLQREAPPLSRIEAVHAATLGAPLPFNGFRIAESVPGENRTRVAPDAAICAACRAEVLDPNERRSGYAFATCTHCGPRFSIVRSVPYDRARTTMASFPMCEACAREYGDPRDRRFHAQPIACAACGPHVWLEGAEESGALRGRDAIDAAAASVQGGRIVALRGLGGFHLVCDAVNAGAVRRLRGRKHRYGKPFALMARDLEMVGRYAAPTPLERRLLESAEAPIVLLRSTGLAPLPDDVAPGLDLLGFMLPYTPLHALLMERLDRPVVMTSGNVSHEPQVVDNEEARTKLASIADQLLLHNRDIANRIDDSVVRIVASRPRLVRRARGYAPAALALPEGFEKAPHLLAHGGELKSTFCVVKDGTAVLSQHQGDLEDLATFDDYQKNLRLYAQMYDHAPLLLVADNHPEYLSTKLAEETASTQGLSLVRVQHHHAHIASCMAENGVALDQGPVLGVALDGLGLGDDGTFWGGEVLLADYRGYLRLGALLPVAMPGGVQAIHEPWRSLYAHLVAAFGWEHFSSRFADSTLCRRLRDKPHDVLARMLAGNVNVPRASSCGRLFDAVAAALGMCFDRADHEAQGAMELEAAAARCPAGETVTGYPFNVVIGDTGFRHLDAAPMWEALAHDLAEGLSVERMAARFQRGLAVGVVALVRAVRSAHAPSVTTAALSGGCFQNAILLEDVVRLLEAEGLTCLSHERVPSNDGGIALGQAVIGAALHIRSNR